MPTTLRRSQITHTPEVERLIAQGRSRWPNASPAAILVRLAQEGARHLPPEPSNGLRVLPAVPGHHLTSEMVAEALDELD